MEGLLGTALDREIDSVNPKHVASSLFLVILLSYTPAYAKLENGMDASVVIGQPDFQSRTANNGGRSALTLSFPTFLYSDGKRLFVGDLVNNRVLIWNAIPTKNFSPADIVLGQPDFTAAVANNGGVSNRSLSFPAGVFFDGQKLFVSDYGNNRVLVWNSLPQSNFQPADIVIGQPDFTTVTSGTTAAKMNSPTGILVSGGRLLVAEESNNRVSVFNHIPTSSGASADMVIGQPDFVTSTSGLGPNKMHFPYGISIGNNKLLIAEFGNGRVSIWNAIPTSFNTPADLVLGQPNFFTSQSRSGSTGMSGPVQVFTDGQRVCVSDENNHRVMVWNQFPKINFQPADFVLGQPDFSTASPSVLRGRMSNAYGVFSDGRHLFTSESANNRILIFNIADEFGVKLGPQFNQGKGVLGKVFNDLNNNATQEKGESGLEGIKVVSDTGIYAITDPDGKYHFPYIETGQHVLKIDESTLPEGSSLTTESPRKILVTEGILTKVSFGVKFDRTRSLGDTSKDMSPPDQVRNVPLLKASISQDPVLLKPTLSVEAKEEKDKLLFTIKTNYQLFIEKAELTLYNDSMKLIQTLELPKPLPYTHTVLLSDIPTTKTLYYRLTVMDKEGRQDRTALGKLTLEAS